MVRFVFCPKTQVFTNDLHGSTPNFTLLRLRNHLQDHGMYTYTYTYTYAYTYKYFSIYIQVIMNHQEHNHGWNGSVMCLCCVCCLCVSAVCLHLLRHINTCVKTGHNTCTRRVALYVNEPRTRKKSNCYLEVISTTSEFEFESTKKFPKRPKSLELISGRMVVWSFDFSVQVENLRCSLHVEHARSWHHLWTSSVHLSGPEMACPCVMCWRTRVNMRHIGLAETSRLLTAHGTGGEHGSQLTRSPAFSDLLGDLRTLVSSW